MSIRAHASSLCIAMLFCPSTTVRLSSVATALPDTTPGRVLYLAHSVGGKGVNPTTPSYDLSSSRSARDDNDETRCMKSTRVTQFETLQTWPPSETPPLFFVFLNHRLNLYHSTTFLFLKQQDCTVVHPIYLIGIQYGSKNKQKIIRVWLLLFVGCGCMQLCNGSHPTRPVACGNA